MKPSVLLAVGCSWVAGKSIDTDPTLETFDRDHIEDPRFVGQHSFAGLLQQRMGLDQLHMLARPGANNDEQLKSLVSFLEANYNNYSKIFVLCGITSVYRWEMYSSSAKAVVNCHPGKKIDSEEVKYYFSNHWNKDYELEKLGTKIIMLDGYLKSLDIDHLFVNSFNSDLQLTIDSFYSDDLLSLLCRKNKIKISNSSVPFLNLLKPKEQQFNSPSVIALQEQCWLDRATAHPTVKAHKLIADELYDYIKEKNNERI